MTIAHVARLLLPATLLTTFAVAATVVDVRAWIGHVAPPWPAGFEHIGGSCVPAEGNVCAYGVTLLRQGNRRWFLMSRSLREPGSKQPRWQVLDVIAVPPVPSTFELAWGRCRVHGRGDSGIVVIVRSDDTRRFLGEVIWTRRANIAAGRFTTPALGAVDCINVGPSH